MLDSQIERERKEAGDSTESGLVIGTCPVACLFVRARLSLSFATAMQLLLLGLPLPSCQSNKVAVRVCGGACSCLCVWTHAYILYAHAHAANSISRSTALMPTFCALLIRKNRRRTRHAHMILIYLFSVYVHPLAEFCERKSRRSHSAAAREEACSMCR